MSPRPQELTEASQRGRFFVIAMIAVVPGFNGIAGNIARRLFVVFVVLAIVSLFCGRRLA